MIADMRALNKLGADREHELLWAPQTEQLHLVTIVSATKGVGMELAKTYPGRYRLKDARIIKGTLLQMGVRTRVHSVWPADEAPAHHELIRIRNPYRGGCEVMAVADNIKAV